MYGIQINKLKPKLINFVAKRGLFGTVGCYSTATLYRSLTHSPETSTRCFVST